MHLHHDRKTPRSVPTTGLSRDNNRGSRAIDSRRFGFHILRSRPISFMHSWFVEEKIISVTSWNSHGIDLDRIDSIEF
ncbi:hypothetical protein FGO68_gene14640 [Halteria grandinella]|uniref:Uncharacterized protein n=1 Tax=Halteria grandinella TaxID=5974 RepID=A0A8J8SYN0_HALGN|nr:hypothetical protein FGO68_gene14640 [Halteria grandinella]